MYTVYNRGNNIAGHLNSPDDCGKYGLSYETNLLWIKSYEVNQVYINKRPV